MNLKKQKLNREVSMATKVPVFFILIGAVATTLLILPTTNFDPISVPKASLLILISSLAAFYFLNAKALTLKLFYDSLFVKLILGFVLLIILNLFKNNYAFEERIFGVSGRSTGAITYISLALITWLLVHLPQKNAALYCGLSLTVANLGVCFYFLLQLSGRDIFSYAEFYAAPSSTLGNPNFVSGFVGFASIATWIFLAKRVSLLTMIFPVFSTIMSLFVLLKSQSIQGLFGFVGGVSVIFILYLKQLSLRLALYLVVLVFVGGIFSVLGFLGYGPLGELLVTTTLLSRFDYWRAAFVMALDSPFFGKGMDSFGDFFRVFRDDIAFNRFGGNQVADSAHSIVFDLLSNGGFPLAIVYILIQGIPAVLVLQKILKSNELDLAEVILFGVWVSYTLQSLISINQIGVGVWGWVLAGLLYAQVDGSNVLPTRSSPRLKLFWAITSLSILFVNVLIALAPLRADSKFLASANLADGLGLKKVSLSWPLDTNRILLTSLAFKNAGYDDIALELALAGVKNNPYSYTLWKQIFESDSASDQLRIEAEGALKKIEPRFVKGS